MEVDLRHPVYSITHSNEKLAMFELYTQASQTSIPFM